MAFSSHNYGDYQSLLSGINRWNGYVVQVMFMTDPSLIPDYPAGAHANPTEFSAEQKAAVSKIATEIESFSALKLYFTQTPDFTRPTIVLFNADLASADYSCRPPSEAYKYMLTAVDADLATPDVAYPSLEQQILYQAMGAAIGLKHPSDLPTAGTGSVDTSTWLLSETRFADFDPFTQDSYPYGYMPFDVAAIQSIYGANTIAYFDGSIYRVVSDTSGQVDIYRNGIDMTPSVSTIQTTIWDSAGYDALDFTGYYLPVDIDLRPGAISGYGGYGVANAFLLGGNTSSLIEAAFGTVGSDLIYGNEIRNELKGNWGDDRIFGMGGDDFLYGNQGNDVLIGGTGSDTLDGDHGFDAVSYEDATAGVTVDLETPSNNSGEAAIDRIFRIENVAGSFFGDVLTGNADNNTLYGIAGNDVLSGGSGNDYLAGGAGDDILTGGSGLDYFVFARGDGNDGITDFSQTDHDVITLGLGQSADTFSELMSFGQQVGDDTVFFFSESDSLTLHSVRMQNLTMNDFYFA